MKNPKSKKTIIIIVIALVCIAVGGVAGFLFGRSSKSAAKPYIVLEDYEYSGKVVKTFESADAAYMTERFGMPADVAADFVENPADWLGYIYYINIENPGSKNYNFFNAECEKNGENDIYMDITSTGVCGIPAGGETQICLTVFAHDNDQSDEDIKAQFLKMGVGYKYSEAEDAADPDARYFTAQLKEIEQ